MRGAYLKTSAVFLIGLAVVLGVFTNYEWIYSAISNYDNLQYIVNVIAIISGFSGVIIGVTGYRTANLEAIKEYFLQGDAPELAKARRQIYDAKNPEKLMERFKVEHDERNQKEEGERKVDQGLSESISGIINFYHLWGLMTKKGYLPIWVFKGSSGRQLIRLHNILEIYIEDKRVPTSGINAEPNPDYAENFSWLCRKVRKKYKY